MADTDFHVRLNGYRDAALEAFETNLENIVKQAQDATLDYLMQNLVIDKGLIVRTPGNLRIIRRLNQLFMAEMNKAGYAALVNSFVAQFPSHLPMIQEQIQTLSQSMKEPLPDVSFTTGDLNVLKSVAISDAKMIRDVISTEASKAIHRVMFSVGGLPFKNMVKVISQDLGIVSSKAAVIADTSQAMWYRVALEQQYEKIQKASPTLTLLYKYTGPNDSRCRPFCDGLMNNRKRLWTRDEIDKMDNRQLPNVMTTAGGFNCRHQFDVGSVTRTSTIV